MKTITIGLVLFISCYSFSATKGFFGNPKKSAIVIQGRDDDFERFYEALIVPEVETQNSFKKQINLVTLDRENVGTISCLKSKHADTFGSCTIEILSTSWTIMTPSSVVLTLDAKHSPALAHYFSFPDEHGLIYQSYDNKLTIKYSDDNNFDKIFSISYR